MEGKQRVDSENPVPSPTSPCETSGLEVKVVPGLMDAGKSDKSGD